MVTLTIEGETDADALELDASTYDLRQRLLELDVEAVVPVEDDRAPVGTRSGEAVVIGSLAVALGPVALRSVVALVDAWLRNRPIRRVTVTIGKDRMAIENAARADVRELVDAFVARHTSHE
jgi:hypothetical protein